MVAGAIVGLSISAPIGPMGAICIHRTLVSGWAAGLATGAGAATILVSYGAAVLFSLGEVTQLLGTHAAALPVLGGLIMIWSAARLASRTLRRDGERPVSQRASVPTAYLSAMAFNATNPILLVLLVSSITSLPVLDEMRPVAMSAALVGMFVGAMTWWACLCGVIVALRRLLTATLLRAVNLTMVAILLVFGISTITRAALQ